MIRAIALVALLAGCATQPSGPITAYEGARLIVGDGSVIENGTILVQDGKIARVGEVRAPEGATRSISPGRR